MILRISYISKKSFSRKTNLPLLQLVPDIEATLNGTILCYAAARADLDLKRTPLFDQAFECAEKSLNRGQLIDMLKMPCDFVISDSSGDISYQENFVQRLNPANVL